MRAIALDTLRWPQLKVRVGVPTSLAASAAECRTIRSYSWPRGRPRHRLQCCQVLPRVDVIQKDANCRDASEDRDLRGVPEMPSPNHKRHEPHEHNDAERHHF